MSSFQRFALALALSLVVAESPLEAAPSIVGDTVEIWGVAQSNGEEFLHDTVVVVDPGVEYTADILGTEIYEINVGPTSILLNSLEDFFSPWFNSGHPPTTLEVRDIDVPGKPWLRIGGVSMIFSETIVPEPDAPPGYPAFSAANASFTDDSVIMHVGPYEFPEGSRLQIEITFVPEPATATLLAGAMMGALTLVRRRSRS